MQLYSFNPIILGKVRLRLAVLSHLNLCMKAISCTFVYFPPKCEVHLWIIQPQVGRILEVPLYYAYLILNTGFRIKHQGNSLQSHCRETHIDVMASGATWGFSIFLKDTSAGLGGAGIFLLLDGHSTPLQPCCPATHELRRLFFPHCISCNLIRQNQSSTWLLDFNLFFSSLSLPLLRFLLTIFFSPFLIPLFVALPPTRPLVSF